MFKKQIWHVVNSKRDGFRVNLTTTDIFWDLLEDFTEFVNHKFLRFIPRLPIPYLHKDLDFCKKNHLHFHNPYIWFGWNYEDQICTGLCWYFGNKSFKSTQTLYSFNISDEMMQQFFVRDSDLKRFYSSIKEIENED